MVHGMSSVGGGISDNGHGVGSINYSVYSVVALEPADTSGGAGAGWSNGASNASNLTGDDDTYTPLLLMSDIVGIWITGLCCLLGLAGNILSFIVLLRAHGHSPMFYVLRAVAISDAIFLLSVFILQTLVNVYSQITVLEWCFVYRGYIQFGIWPVMMMTQMSTVWLTVLVSMERYVAICYPLHSARICTISKVRKAVIFTFVTAVLYNIPRYFEYKVVYVTFEDNLTGIYNFEKTTLAHNLVYRFLYNGISYALVLFFIPLMLLIILNFKLVWALQLGKKRWRTLQFRQRKEQNLTIIPLCIVLVFFICGTPALVVNMIDSMDPYSMQNTWFVIFMVIANLLVVLNSACNFIIYCLLGKKFRLQLSAMCRCRCRPYHVVHLLAPTQFSEL